MSTHLIDSVKFDIQADNTNEAKDLQDKIFSICRYQLGPALDASMADEADQFSLIKDRLTLDLGYIAKDVLETQLIPRLLEAFTNAIGELKLEYQSGDNLKYDLEAIQLFLEKGARHWSKGEDFDPLTDLLEMLDKHWPKFLKFLKRTPMQMQVSTRLVAISPDKTYRQLITRLRTSDSDFILGFIKSAVNMMENSKSVTQPKSHWEGSLKALVLHDLIKNHNSLFNRKMFIHRQLMRIASRHRVDYLELLKVFEELLSENEIAYKHHVSLPALIKELASDVHHSPDDSASEKSKPDWLMLFDKNKWQPKNQQILKANWGSWVSQYPGEIKRSFEAKLRTVEQVEFVVEQLSDEKVDDLIGILIPHLSKYVISYKRSVINGNKEANVLSTAEDNLTRTLNFLILSYLTLDMGTSFNKREFFTQQIVRISRHYNLNYEAVVTFLVNTLDSAGQPILFGMLELIRQISDSLISRPQEDVGPDFDTQDELELLFYYLVHGRLHAEMDSAQTGHPFEFLMRVLIKEKHAKELLDFIQNHKQELVGQVRVYDTTIFLQLVKLILNKNVSLSSQEAKIITGQIKKHSRQAVDQGSFRSYIFEYISGLGRKIDAREVRKYDLDDIQDPYSLLCRFLIVKLSLTEFYSEKLKGKPLNPKSAIKSMTYDQARSQLFASLDHLMIPDKSNMFHQAQIQASLSKILESKQESQSLMYTLSNTQLLLMLKHGNKTSRFKILHLLAEKHLVLKVLLQKMDIRVINDDQLEGWTQVLLLDFSQNASELKMQLQQVLGQLQLESYVTDEMLKSIGALKKDQTRRQNEELDLLTRFFATATSPSGWSLVAIETLFLKHYKTNFRNLVKALAGIVYHRQTVVKLHDLLGKNIIVRWMKIIMGKGFDQFSEEIENLLQILAYLDPSGLDKLYDPEELEKFKIFAVFEYQFRKVNFEVLVRYFIRYHIENRSVGHKEFRDQLSNNLNQEINRIKPEILKKRAKEIQQILASDIQIDDEELATGMHEESMPDDSYKIENAGLILIWPFLKNLFNQLEYLSDDGTFKSTYEQSLAVRLLQYAATGETSQPEYNMTLNKLLCGFPLVEPLERTPEISESEKKVAESMLEGLIANWPKLGNTSIEGLRNTFLLRKGSLTREESNWTLRVEKKGMDVLLDFLPWTITNIKTPWLEGMLFVEWR